MFGVKIKLKWEGWWYEPFFVLNCDTDNLEPKIAGLVQERHNSSALGMELHVLALTHQNVQQNIGIYTQPEPVIMTLPLWPCTTLTSFQVSL